MPAEEGDALWDAAVAAAAVVPDAPFLEVGSYCGRSTVWLGDAAERTGRLLFAVDHHRGSEENQPGWEHHDSDVVDLRTGKMDTLPFFRSAIHDAGLEVLPAAGCLQFTTCSLIRLMVAGRHTKRSTSRRSSREISLNCRLPAVCES